MQDTLLIVLGALFLLAGLVGCLLPILPGPPLAYVGLILLHFTERVDIPRAHLFIGFILVLLAWVLDAMIPALGAKRWGGTRWGVLGCLTGAFVGIFVFPPVGFVLGSFLGAIVGELLGGKHGADAFLAGIGALVGFLLGTVIKVALCGLFIYWFVVALVKT